MYWKYAFLHRHLSPRRIWNTLLKPKEKKINKSIWFRMWPSLIWDFSSFRDHHSISAYSIWEDWRYKNILFQMLNRIGLLVFILKNIIHLYLYPSPQSNSNNKNGWRFVYLKHIFRKYKNKNTSIETRIVWIWFFFFFLTHSQTYMYIFFYSLQNEIPVCLVDRARLPQTSGTDYKPHDEPYWLADAICLLT